jgi:flagellar motor switch protein FliM
MTDDQLPGARAPLTRHRRLRTIDFTRPTKFTPDQQRRLERAYTSFCRSASTRMSAELRTTISVELGDTVQLTWANALDALPLRAVSGVVDVAPIDGRMLLSAELTLLLGLLEPVLGGQAHEQPAERWLTDVDRALTRRIFQTLLDELSISFGRSRRAAVQTAGAGDRARADPAGPAERADAGRDVPIQAR